MTTWRDAPIGICHDGELKLFKCVITSLNDNKDGIHQAESIVNVNGIVKVI